MCTFLFCYYAVKLVLDYFIFRLYWLIDTHFHNNGMGGGKGPAWVLLDTAAVRDDLESLARDSALPILRIKAYEEFTAV